MRDMQFRAMNQRMNQSRAQSINRARGPMTQYNPRVQYSRTQYNPRIQRPLTQQRQYDSRIQRPRNQYNPRIQRPMTRQYNQMTQHNSRVQRPKQGQNILFYSKYCNHCKKFEQALLKTKVNNTFFKICVDIKGVKIPPFVTHVPTIIVYDKNQHKHVLSDKAAFEWLNELLDTPINISDYKPGEMGSSLSDTYAFLDEKQEIEHNFAFLDSIDNNFIYTPPETQDIKDTDSRLEALQKQRTLDDPSHSKRPPPKQPDFQKGFVQTSSSVNDSDYNRLLSLRQRESRNVGAVPLHAPNFQRTNFKSDMFQSNRGNRYQPAGYSSDMPRGNTFNTSLRDQNRNTYKIQRPQNKPNFSHSLKPLRVV